MNGTVYREMQDAEFDEKQAGAIDHAIRDGQAELATKADLATFEQRLGDKLDARFVGIETNLRWIMWIGGPRRGVLHEFLADCCCT